MNAISTSFRSIARHMLEEPNLRFVVRAYCWFNDLDPTSPHDLSVAYHKVIDEFMAKDQESREHWGETSRLILQDNLALEVPLRSVVEEQNSLAITPISALPVGSVHGLVVDFVNKEDDKHVCSANWDFPNGLSNDEIRMILGFCSILEKYSESSGLGVMWTIRE